MYVRAPGLDFTFGDVDRPFHAASVGKAMTATLIGMLAEEGRLELTTPIGRLLPAHDVRGLPAAPGVDVGADVSVGHLLSHTSGLPDHFLPPRGHDSACSVANVVTEPSRPWTAAEQLDEVRRLPAIGRPGQRFHYGDPAYVLLGRVLEEVTGEPFTALLRSRILDVAGMERTSTPYCDARAPHDLDGVDVAPFWIDGHEMSHALAMGLDWAAGGIVAPAGDLVRFQEALHGGRFISPRLLSRLSLPRHRFRPGIHYGTGLVTVRFGGFSPTLRGLPQPVGGLGYFAVHMFYYPGLDAHVVLNFHTHAHMQQSFRTHIRIAQLLARD